MTDASTPSRCVLEAGSAAVDDAGALRENIGFDEHGVLHVVLLRGTTTPAMGQVVLSTSVDDQTEIVLHVLRGNRMMSRDATALGAVVVPVRPQPRGLPQVTLTIGVDGGDVVASAVDADGAPLPMERRVP